MGHEQKHNYDYSDLNIVPFKGRQRFDDDFRGLPRKGFRGKNENTSLRFFKSSNGDRVITNINKERPELSLLIKVLEIGENDLVVNLNADDGVIGSTIASLYPGNKVILMDNNLYDIAVAQRNTTVNALTNAEVIPAIGIQDFEKLIEGHPTIIVYTPSPKLCNFK